MPHSAPAITGTACLLTLSPYDETSKAHKTLHGTLRVDVQHSTSALLIDNANQKQPSQILRRQSPQGTDLKAIYIRKQCRGWESHQSLTITKPHPLKLSVSPSHLNPGIPENWLCHRLSG